MADQDPAGTDGGYTSQEGPREAARTADQAAAESEAAAREEASYRAALSRALRLFAVYVAAGGALCMRQTVWRRLMPSLHPDRGGDVRVFQRVAELKRQVDAGEELDEAALTPPLAGAVLEGGDEGGKDDEAAELIGRLREEMRRVAAQP